MVRGALPLRPITVLVAVSVSGGSDGLLKASLSGEAPHGTVVIHGVTVPDLVPLPVVVPVSSFNCTHAAKIELEKHLYFGGGFRGITPFLGFLSQSEVGFGDSLPTSIGVGGGMWGRQLPKVYNMASTMWSSGMRGRVP